MIDWDKVAVIHNTQYANSQEVAEYYATARGIPAGNVQGFALGTAAIIGSTNASRDTFRNGVLTNIRDYCSSNGIEAVALSICCPRRYGHDPENVTRPGVVYASDRYSAFCRAISDADRIVTVGGSQAAQTLLPVNASFQMNFGGTKSASGIRLNNGTSFLFDWRGATLSAAYDHVFCGRLGYGNETISADSVALAKRCIDDAIWYETNGNPATSPIIFGMSTRTGYLEHGNVYAAWRKAVNAGCLNTLKYNGDHDNSAGSLWSAHDWGYAEPSWDIPDTQVWLNGGGPVFDMWGCLGTGLENNAGEVANLAVNSVSIQRGAWVFESTSSNVSGQCIPHGLTAAVCPVQEPFSTGVPEISGFMQYLLMGFSMEEACVMSCRYTGACSTEVWGDPFYSPFANFPFGSYGQGIGIQ